MSLAALVALEVQALLESALDQGHSSLRALLLGHVLDPFPFARQRLVLLLPPPANLAVLALDLALVCRVPFAFLLVVDSPSLRAVLVLLLLRFRLLASKDGLELLLERLLLLADFAILLNTTNGKDL